MNLAQNIISNEREEKELTIYSFPETDGSTEMLDLNVNLNVLLKILNFRIKNKKKQKKIKMKKFLKEFREQETSLYVPSRTAKKNSQKKGT